MNTLTGVLDEVGEVDEDYADTELMHGLKPNVYYSCRYQRQLPNQPQEDFVITYTMDNYITIDGYLYFVDPGNGDNGGDKGNAGLNYVHESGYLMGIGSNNEKLLKEKVDGKEYVYDGITFSAEDDEEVMKEYLGEVKEGELGNKEYYYVKINGTKYYYNGLAKNKKEEANNGDYIFYLKSDGTDAIQVIKKDDNNSGGTNTTQAIKAEVTSNDFADYEQTIFGNIYSVRYYENAYKFTDKCLNKYNLGNLTVKDIYNYNSDENIRKSFTTNGNIFRNYENDNGKDIMIQDSDSTFNQHRAEVIRYVMETNLSTSISAFRRYSNSNIDFLMPKISETDWELLENNICIATFMQGMSIGGKVYNSYAVVPNTLNKEYVDENDIYILTTNGEYTKANDSKLIGENKKLNIQEKNAEHNYYAGILNINFESRMDSADRHYNPMIYDISTKTPYYASYTGITGSSSLKNITTSDMYKYMRNLNTSVEGVSDLKKAYYHALGRERYSSYHLDNEVKNFITSSNRRPD